MNTSAPPNGTCNGLPWQKRSQELGRLAFDVLVSRVDRYGRYRPEGGAWTYPSDPEKQQPPRPLTPQLLAAHFRGEPWGTVGLLTLNQLGQGRESVLDLDAHDKKPFDPVANRQFTEAVHAKCAAAGFVVLAYGSDGKGGFHTRAPFKELVPGWKLRRFSAWLADGWQAAGVSSAPDEFPKQDKPAPDGCGNYVRLPGKKPKRDYWSEVYDGKEWLAGEAAVAHVLKVLSSPNDPARIAEVCDVGNFVLRATSSAGWEVLPSEDFNRRNPDPRPWLLNYQWTKTGGTSKEEYWRHPDAENDKSATIGRKKCETSGADMVYVFTPNTPLTQHAYHPPAAVRCAYEFGGDWSKFHVALVAEGYGVRAKPTTGQTSSAGGSGHAAPEWEPPVPLPDLPPAPAFPLHLFPAAVADYWSAAAEALHVPVDYIAGPGIAVLGAAVGRSRAAEVKPGYAESALPWVVVVAPPGGTKTASLRAARDPLDTAEADWRADHAVKLKDYETAVARYEKELKDWKKTCEGDPPEKPTKPTLRQVVLDDTTTEAAAKVLRDNPRGCVLVKDELIGMARSLNQYKGGKGNDKTFWLTAWNGKGVVKVNRAKDHDAGPIVVVDPFIAVGGMLCPDVLPELREELVRGGAVADGWADRFLFCYPDPLPAVGETWKTISEDVAKRYADVVGRLLAKEMVLDQGATHRRPFFDRFNSSARKAWQAFTEDIAGRMNALSPGDPYRGVLSKLKHYGVRFAALYYAVELAANDLDPGSEIPAACVESAHELILYFDGHNRRCLNVTDRAADPARIVLGIIGHAGGILATSGHGQISKRAIFRRLRGQTRFRRADSLDAPLRLLEAHGYIRSIDPEAGRGRPAERFAINPLWDRSPHAPDGQNGQKSEREGEYDPAG